MSKDLPHCTYPIFVNMDEEFNPDRFSEYRAYKCPDSLKENRACGTFVTSAIIPHKDGGTPVTYGHRSSSEDKGAYVSKSTHVFNYNASSYNSIKFELTTYYYVTERDIASKKVKNGFNGANITCRLSIVGYNFGCKKVNLHGRLVAYLNNTWYQDKKVTLFTDTHIHHFKGEHINACCGFAKPTEENLAIFHKCVNKSIQDDFEWCNLYDLYHNGRELGIPEDLQLTMEDCKTLLEKIRNQLALTLVLFRRNLPKMRKQTEKLRKWNSCIRRGVPYKGKGVLIQVPFRGWGVYTEKELLEEMHYKTYPDKPVRLSPWASF